MGSVVNCRKNQVRFSFYLDDKKKGQEYGCALTVKEYKDGTIRLVSEPENGVELHTAACAALAFLKNTSSIGTAKRIAEVGEAETVKAVRIDLESKDKPTISILVPKDAKTNFSIEA